MNRWHPGDRGRARTFEIFLRTFEKFKSDIDDDERGLDKLAQNDEDIGNTLRKLFWLRSQVDDQMRSSPKGFSQSSPVFRTHIVDFDRRFKEVAGRQVMRNAIIWTTPASVPEGEKDNEPHYPEDPAEHLDEMIDIVRDYVEEGKKLAPWSELPERDAVTFLAGVETWDELQKSTSFDPVAILRRRRGMQFLFLGQSSKKNGNVELVRMLEDAQKSYIFGAHLSAIAILRSILEIIFKKHFGLFNERSGLQILIAEYIKKFNISKEKASDIHNFRLFANKVLHEPRGVSFDIEEFEKSTVKYFIMVQQVIDDMSEV